MKNIINQFKTAYNASEDHMVYFRSKPSLLRHWFRKKYKSFLRIIIYNISAPSTFDILGDICGNVLLIHKHLL